MSEYATRKYVNSKALDAAGFAIGARVVVSERIKSMRRCGPHHVGRHGTVVEHHDWADLVYVELEAVGRKATRTEMFRPAELDLVGGEA